MFWPELNGDGEPVTHSQVRELRNRVYLRLTEHLNVSESRACFDLVHRMICEYVYSPCDPSSVQYSDVRKSWKQPVCASDCYRARTEFCSAKWDGLILHIKSTDLNTTLGNDLDCSTPTAEDEDYVLRSQCVTSLRYGESTSSNCCVLLQSSSIDKQCAEYMECSLLAVPMHCVSNFLRRFYIGRIFVWLGFMSQFPFSLQSVQCTVRPRLSGPLFFGSLAIRKKIAGYRFTA